MSFIWVWCDRQNLTPCLVYTPVYNKLDQVILWGIIQGKQEYTPQGQIIST